MQVRRAALAAWLLLGAGIPAWAVDPMTLDDAFDRVAQAHPDLRLVQARTAVLAAEHEGANQRPPWTLGAEVENALSTGDARGLDSAEFTVPGCSAQSTAFGCVRATSMAAVFTTMFSAAFDAR